MKYVIYSHTDYLDILSIQTEYLKLCSNKILLINTTELDISNITTQYNEVIYYDDSLPYASRLLSLSILKDQYILFIHDIDILAHHDSEFIDSFTEYMNKNNVDRIDLQVRHSWDYNTPKVNFNNIILSKQENSNNYIYNVNPSIWKLSSLLDVMYTFKNESYRSIETAPTQIYCKKLNVYKLYSDNYIRCGWFSCLDFFQFIHITHYGKLLPKTKNNLDVSLISEYINIIDKLSAMNSNREFSTKSL